jgi:hypothetical protein
MCDAIMPRWTKKKKDALNERVADGDHSSNTVEDGRNVVHSIIKKRSRR